MTQINTDYSVHYKAGCVAYARGNVKEAIKSFESALELKPNYADAHSNLGVILEETGDLEAALEKFKKKSDKIDIIVTDVVMPGMTGPDMMEEIAKIRADVKVVFVSGYGEDAFIETYGMERKFNFLSKPYTLKQLATKVKEVLESK
jgi:two-component system cell cycle sensor histidine kinase/response regulator CckA